MSVSSSPEVAMEQRSDRAERLIGSARFVRSYARLTSGLILLSFVLCHFAAHIFLLVSLPVADKVLNALMLFWRSNAGTWLLTAAFTVHVSNALWSIYIRRYLRMPVWEIVQLVFGLAIPPLIIIHVIGTKVADQFLGTATNY